jgi:flagellin
MPINSVQTNNSAMVALQTLNYTNSQLQNVQKQISTGFRVSDAADDGAAYAVAQGIRATVGSLTSANQQLNGVQGLLSTSMSSLNNISNTLTTMRGLVVKLADDTTSGQDRLNYQDQYTELSANLGTFIKDSTYNGNSQIDAANPGNVKVGTGPGTGLNVSSNDAGGTYNLVAFDATAALSTVVATAAGVTAAALLGANTGTAAAPSAGSAALLISPGAGGALSIFDTAVSAVNTALNTVGGEVNSVKNQVSFNSDKMDALNSGVGSLVDADLAKESAQLQALQIRQQLGTQSLAIANQAPAALLSLFK